MKRPNIVIINPDQMRADALHHLGNEAASTPYMDALAAEVYPTVMHSVRILFASPVAAPSQQETIPMSMDTALCSISCGGVKVIYFRN